MYTSLLIRVCLKRSFCESGIHSDVIVIQIISIVRNAYNEMYSVTAIDITLRKANRAHLIESAECTKSDVKQNEKLFYS